jgi:hypothetical protein
MSARLHVNSFPGGFFPGGAAAEFALGIERGLSLGRLSAVATSVAGRAITCQELPQPSRRHDYDIARFVRLASVP